MPTSRIKELQKRGGFDKAVKEALTKEATADRGEVEALRRRLEAMERQLAAVGAVTVTGTAAGVTGAVVGPGGPAAEEGAAEGMAKGAAARDTSTDGGDGERVLSTNRARNVAEGTKTAVDDAGVLLAGAEPPPTSLAAEPRDWKLRVLQGYADWAGAVGRALSGALDAVPEDFLATPVCLAERAAMQACAMAAGFGGGSSGRDKIEDDASAGGGGGAAGRNSAGGDVAGGRADGGVAAAEGDVGVDVVDASNRRKKEEAGSSAGDETGADKELRESLQRDAAPPAMVRRGLQWLWSWRRGPD
ncbi:unnamed protein product [Phaeothamnion confervicola]